MTARFASQALGFGVCLAMVPWQAAAEDRLEAKQAEIERDYARSLEELAAWCAKEQLAEPAAATRAWIVPRAPLTLALALPSAAWGEMAEDGHADASEWAERFRKLRIAQAERLYALALEGAEARKYALAFQLVYATLRENPDHEAARRLLGYKRHEDKWLTRYELTKAQVGQVWHPRFGWVDTKRLARYENGERFVKGRWISADEDAALHAEIDRGWDVITEHYQVRTNHSLEEGVRLAERLEEFYEVWRQLFVRFYASDEQLARLFRDGATSDRMPRTGAGRRHVVIYFRDRDEYISFLGREHPNIGITNGYYHGPVRRAFFFAGAEDEAAIWHEATHQLFSETRSTKLPGEEANFWVIEGIACFMESYKAANQVALLGGQDAVRLENARTRLQRDHFYIGLRELCRLGMEELKGHAEIRAVYSQSSGMTYFLMYAQQGRYRQTLIDYLSTVYANRDQPDTLARLAGASYDELDTEYQRFIHNLP